MAEDTTDEPTTETDVPEKKFMRGAKPTPRHKLCGARPHRITGPVPAQWPLVLPSFLEMWLNNQYGDCVTAEEAAAKALWSVVCGLPETKITDATVKAFCDKYGFLDGAMLDEVMDKMVSDGFHQDAGYKDGSYSSVDYSNEAVLQSAIYTGPVKLGMDADALPSGAGNVQGWTAFGGSPGQYNNEDHSTGLWAYGPTKYLANLIATTYNVTVNLPSNAPPSGYIHYTWSTVGIVDHAWIMSTVGEAWVRNPTTVGQLPTPTPVPPPPGPTPVPTPSWFKEAMDGLLEAIIEDFPDNPILVKAATWIKALIDGWFSTANHRAAFMIPWSLIITIVTTLLQTLGPLAVPYIENMIAKLHLPPALVLIIDALIEQYLGYAVVRSVA